MSALRKKIATAARASLSSTHTRWLFPHPLRRQASLVPRSAPPAPLWRLSSLTGGQDDAEPELAVAAVRGDGVAVRRPAVERVAVPNAASKHAAPARPETTRISLRATRIRTIPVPAPLHHIPCHV